MTKMVVATKDIKVNINGIEYDCLLIPVDNIVDVDFTNAPELHPMVQNAIKAVKNKTLSLENFGYYDSNKTFVTNVMPDDEDNVNE